MDFHATDEALLVRFARGDRDALGELAQRYELPLLGVARGILGWRNDVAMDVVQETWMKVIRYAKSFNRRSSVKTWLYRIAINQCKNILQRQARSVGDDTPSLVETVADQSDVESVAESIERRETNCTLHEALQQLNITKRTVLLLCYHAEMTHEQAAAILEIPVGTLKSRLHAALDELRSALSVEAHK
jgi:RNA polymerase sigma-70 factor, ECF subfamily